MASLDHNFAHGFDGFGPDFFPDWDDGTIVGFGVQEESAAEFVKLGTYVISKTFLEYFETGG